MQEAQVWFPVHAATASLLEFPDGSADKESACNAGDIGDEGLVPGLELFPREGNGNHSGILVWKILWTEEPDGQQSHGLQRVEHDWVTKHTHMVYHIDWFV